VSIIKKPYSQSLSELSYRLLVDSIVDYAIYMLDPDGRILTWNKGAEQAKGYKPREIIGKNFELFFTSDDQANGWPRLNLKEALDKGRFEESGWRVKKDGSLFWAHIIIDPIYDESGVHLGFAKITRDRTEFNEMNEKLKFLARFDALTGLPNRVQFVELLSEFLEVAKKNSSYFALINIDLDRFKEINDGYGHKIGDQLLQRLAKRITKDLGETEVVSRLSGDEFAAAKLFSNKEDLHHFVFQLHQSLTRAVHFGSFEAQVGASIGISIFPDDAQNVEQLFENADLAMYRAKASFDEKICFYEPSMDEASRTRRLLARDMFIGLRENQFSVVYQVQKSLISDEVLGYEALLRWNHPALGNIAPAIFIPIAEECGAINQLGDWVLETACREAALWNKPYKLAVNLSPIQLASNSLADRVGRILKTTGFPSQRLELEVTETAIISDKGHALHVLRQIQALGIRVAIDDFGVGYSSFETLRSFSFDKIKIDKSFVAQLGSDRQAIAFIRAILSLGHSLDIPVLAEGVETREQAEILSLEGCTEVQGFFFGRPAPTDNSM